jgi:hypothetical protein
MLLTHELHLAARIFAEENPVASLHIGCHQLAGLVYLALADRDNLALLWLFFRGIGDNYPPLVLSSSFMRITSMRSPNGLIFIGTSASLSRAETLDGGALKPYDAPARGN